VNACTFVTNASFSFTLSDGKATTADDSDIGFLNLGVAEQNVLKGGLDLDFKPPRSPDEATILRFERTQVPLTGYDLFLRGRLVVAVGDDTGLSVNGLYRLLVDEIVSRANDTNACISAADMFARKSLCKADLDGAISAAQTRRSVLDHWTIVDDELKSEGRTSRDRIGLHTAALSYIQARAKRDDDATLVSNAARKAATDSAAALDGTTSLIAAATVLRLATTLPLGIQIAGDALEAAMLVEAFEAIHG
jgi:hypothetical protein